MRELISARWNEVEALLDALLEIPAEQRESELRRRCADEPLCTAVRQLLALDARDDVALDQVALALGGRNPSASADGMEGQHVGPYRIERALGEGGMGAVFLAARQTEEFTQHVALKLLRSGLFSASQQEQFRREQQIHARLEHPHIARIYDSGISTAGVPYFAMEYIDGTAVTEYCDGHRLGIEARLKLFATICEAVAYAHQNLIVHRDLKPTNILVGANGEPKLLDFGIAKLLPSGAGEGQRTHTELRQLTPNYAAPEQFDGGAITTATDVYALGVLLCELLTGARPPPASTDSTPLRASSRTTDPEAAAARNVSPRTLKRQLRGDLESIIGKALQSEPQRRYPGAAALREDIARHLQGKPIRARPDAATYRVGKFIQRHKVGFAASLTLIATLIAATVFSIGQARNAQREAARATAEADRANAVKTFLLDLFESSAPGNPSHIETADAMLTKGLEQARTAFKEQPDLQVDVLRSVGDIQHRRGQYDAARAPLEEAVALAQKQFGAADARTLDAVVALSRLDEAKGEYAQAQMKLEKAVTAYRAGAGPESVPLAHALQQLGMMRLRQREVEPAVHLEQEALAMYRRLLPEDRVEINEAMIGLGDALDHAGKSEQAIALYRDAVARTRRMYGDIHVLTAEALSYLAAPLRDVGRVAEAEAAMREAVDIDRKVYLAPNLHASDALYELGKTLLAEGKAEESESIFREELAIEQKLFPDGHPNIASTLKNIAAARAQGGHDADAERLLRESLVMDLHLRGEDHPYIAQSRTNLARILIHEDKLDEAQSLLDAALTADHKRYGQSHPSIAADLIGVAELAAARDDKQAALDAVEQALAMSAKALPETHPTRLDAQLHAAEYLLATQRNADAQTRFAATLQTARAATPPVPITVVRILMGLARADLALGLKTDAQQALREARAEVAKISGDSGKQQTEIAQLLTAAR